MLWEGNIFIWVCLSVCHPQGQGGPHVTIMVYSHWLSLGPGEGPGPESGSMVCMFLSRTFHIAPEQDRDLNRDREE